MFLSAVLALVSSWGLFVGGCKFLKHSLCKGVFHEIDPVCLGLLRGSLLGGSLGLGFSSSLLSLGLSFILGLGSGLFLRGGLSLGFSGGAL